ncbi:MAG: alpha/beta fold hydrolase [Gammaproteobacteria bacterium]|nr:alpha/beta fold hydrolase [Gammaproteobacteria bacterium]
MPNRRPNVRTVDTSAAGDPAGRPGHSVPAVLIVPGLRDAVQEHWQTLLAGGLGERAVMVPPMGREDLTLTRYVAAIESAARSIPGPFVVVAHSGGAITTVHWARHTKCAVHGALLAAPPDFDTPMPQGYPTLAALKDGGWLPVPRQALAFPSIVAASRNDPLSRYERSAELAQAWGSRLVDLGEVGHLNPASGFGPWPPAEDFINELSADVDATKETTWPR